MDRTESHYPQNWIIVAGGGVVHGPVRDYPVLDSCFPCGPVPDRPTRGGGWIVISTTRRVRDSISIMRSSDMVSSLPRLRSEIRDCVQ